jgi:hypothetical protein
MFFSIWSVVMFVFPLIQSTTFTVKLSGSFQRMIYAIHEFVDFSPLGSVILNEVPVGPFV